MVGFVPCVASYSEAPANANIGKVCGIANLVCPKLKANGQRKVLRFEFDIVANGDVVGAIDSFQGIGGLHKPDIPAKGVNRES